MDKPKPETIGHTKCPVCQTGCDVRVNKNRVVYTMCEMGHMTKCSSWDSRKIIPALAKGESHKIGFNVFYSNKMKGKADDATSGNDIGRRASGGNTNTGSGGGVTAGVTGKQSIGAVAIDERYTDEDDGFL